MSIERQERPVSQLEAVISAWEPLSVIDDVENGLLVSSLTCRQQLVATCRSVSCRMSRSIIREYFDGLRWWLRSTVVCRLEHPFGTNRRISVDGDRVP
jgi:hypothetical protein